LAAGAIAPAAANAAISVSSPVTKNLYVDSVFVSWSTTTTPTLIQMVWTCTAGYCLHVGTSPVTLNLVSISTHSSFSYNPGATTNAAVFSNWPGPMPDGTWSVQMKYIDASSVTFPSSTILQVQTSTETTPPDITSPAANSLGNTIPVAYTLYSGPLGTPASNDPTLTFTNTATSTVSALRLSASVTNGSFTLNPANLGASSSVLAVSGPNSLADGSYDVALTYIDTQGHPAATTINHDWTLDTSTPTPALSAPAPGVTESGPFNVTFDLPHTPQSGSVQLTIDGSIWPITLSLGDTTAGVHTISLNPNALNSDPDVTGVSWNELPAGAYTMSVAYQDMFGNPTATSTPTSFTIADSSASTTGTNSATTTGTATEPTGVVPTLGLAGGRSGRGSPSVELSPRVLRTHIATLPDQRIRTSVELPAAGDVDIIATAADPTLPWASISSAPSDGQVASPLHAGWHRFAFASMTATKTHAGGYSFTLTPTLKGELLIRRHRRHGWAMHVRVTIEYRGTGGQWVVERREIEILRAGSQRL
jgi:hypothetical protein